MTSDICSVREMTNEEQANTINVFCYMLFCSNRRLEQIHAVEYLHFIEMQGVSKCGPRIKVRNLKSVLVPSASSAHIYR